MKRFTMMLMLLLLMPLVCGAGQKRISGDPVVIVDGHLDIGDAADSFIDFMLTGDPAYAEARVFWDSTNNALAYYNDEADVVMQMGQELWIEVLNDSGGDILDGSVVRVNGASGGYPEVILAKADSPLTTDQVVGMATHTIEDGTNGYVTTFGSVRDLDTSGCAAGAVLYVSASAAGEFTDTQPEYPNFIMRVGQCQVSDGSDGIVHINVVGRIEDILENAWNGDFIEPSKFTIAAAGAVITGSLEQDGGGDLTMNFSDGMTVLDTTPAVTIALTAGTDINPQKNFVYIPESTKVLTVSTSDWPATEHIKVCTAVLQTAATTITDDALGNRNWNDHVAGTNSQGHVLHVCERIRQEPARWHSGAEGSSTIDTGPTPDDVWVANTAGKVYQLHQQTFPALDLETGDDLHVVNSSVAAYTTITNLNTQVLDANGNSLANASFSFVLWGVQNRTGETSHLMLNLPTDTYPKNSPDLAVSDALNYSVYDIPDLFRGTGFLIARFTYVLQAGGASWSLYDTEDLRGKTPNTTAGGGAAGGGGVTTFLGLTDTPNAYTGEALKIAQVNGGETALEFVDQTWTDAGATTHLTSATDDLAVGGSTSASPMFMDVSLGTLNLNSLSASGGLTINNTAGDGDPVAKFQLSGTTQYVMGVNDGATDVFQINRDTALSSSYPSFAITYASEHIGLGIGTPSNTLHVYEDSAETGNAGIKHEQNGAGDSAMQWDAGGQVFVAGIDNSATNDPWALCDGTSLAAGGATSRLEIDGSTGALTLNNAYTLPAADGAATYVLKTDGAGAVSWAADAGGAVLWTDGGASTYLTSTTDDVQLGDNSGTYTDGRFYMDVSDSALYLGYKATQDGKLILQSAAGGSTSLQSSSATADKSFDWPADYPASNDMVLASDTSGVMDWVDADEINGALWQRNGTELSPSTAGDNVEITAAAAFPEATIKGIATGSTGAGIFGNYTHATNAGYGVAGLTSSTSNTSYGGWFDQVRAGLYADFDEVAAPANAGAGDVRLYAKTTGRLYTRDDAGDTIRLGDHATERIIGKYAALGAEGETWKYAAVGLTPVVVTSTAVTSFDYVNYDAENDYGRWRWTSSGSGPMLAQANVAITSPSLLKPATGTLGNTLTIYVRLKVTETDRYDHIYLGYNQVTDANAGQTIRGKTDILGSLTDATWITLSIDVDTSAANSATGDGFRFWLLAMGTTNDADVGDTNLYVETVTGAFHDE